ncbi:MAG: zinc ribbon domain-containing protein [Rhodothermales bacterium]|nr:zinc ribbon domain-containing protein [Rhodothermales bacterium]
MPTYVYRRQDGTTFEVEQRITEDALATCPTTGQPVTRVISGGTGLIFKGSGFYLTDYARNQNGSPAVDNAKTNGKAETSEGTADKPAKKASEGPKPKE